MRYRFPTAINKRIAEGLALEPRQASVAMCEGFMERSLEKSISPGYQGSFKMSHTGIWRESITSSPPTHASTKSLTT